MKLVKIPDDEAIALLRELGLLVGQAGIYGPAHNVTLNAARSAFPALEQIVGRHGAIEITLREKKILVNGGVLDVGGSSGKNLLDRMALHKVEGIAFLPPLDMDEFLQCVTLFGTPPMSLAAEGGFEEAMKKANLRSVQVVNVTYRRVSKDQAVGDKPDAARVAKPRAPRRPSATTVAGVLDMATAQPGAADTDAEKVAEVAETTRRQAAAAVRKQRATAMAELLREAAALLEQEGASESEDRQQHLMGAFDQIRDMLTAITADSENQIKTFAGQVRADRKTIADIESAARRRGIGLLLTRGELMAHHAEINQEILQPLTVSTGVIDLLNSGRAGDLTSSQRELLKMAGEAIERVNHLITHLKDISGMPESLVPDEAILKEAYVTKDTFVLNAAYRSKPPEEKQPGS